MSTNTSHTVVYRQIATNNAPSRLPPATTRIQWLARHMPDPEDQRQYARERCVVAVTEALGGAMEEAGLTKAQLAARLGRTRAYVSKMLNGAHNMTLHSLGDMLWACNVEVVDLELGPLGVIEVATDDAVAWESADPSGPSPQDNPSYLRLIPGSAS